MPKIELPFPNKAESGKQINQAELIGTFENCLAVCREACNKNPHLALLS